MSGFERLIRFEDPEGVCHYGDFPSHISKGMIEGSNVTILSGDIASGFSRTSEKKTVQKLLCPLPHVPIIRCIGLNYKHHAKEANLTIPTHPVVFTKPVDALTGPYTDIHIHPDAQSQLDYEGELTVIIGRDAKNVSVSDALSYVLGYTVGNDVSARDFQIPASVSGGQYSYAKSFDGFAPIGPCIIASELVPDPQQLKYVTKVNGEIRQSTSTEDMIWTVKQIIAHLSRGTTLRKGTAIMTGTPSGVGLFMKPVQGFLKHGDVVEVEVEGIGAIKNRVMFD